MSDGSSSSGSGSLDDVGGNPSAAKSPASAADSALGNMGTVSSAATGAEKTTGKTSGVSVPTTKTKAPASVRPGRQSRMLQMVCSTSTIIYWPSV